MSQLHFFEHQSFSKTIKHEFDLLFKTGVALTSLRINLFLLFGIWIVYGLFFRFLPPEVPLLFSKPYGVEQLVSKQFLAILPGIVTVLFIINTRVASLTLEKDKLLAYIVLWSQTVFGLLASITLLRIILLLA